MYFFKNIYVTSHQQTQITRPHFFPSFYPKTVRITLSLVSPTLYPAPTLMMTRFLVFFSYNNISKLFPHFTALLFTVLPLYRSSKRFLHRKHSHLSLLIFGFLSVIHSCFSAPIIYVLNCTSYHCKKKKEKTIQRAAAPCNV